MLLNDLRHDVSGVLGLYPVAFAKFYLFSHLLRLAGDSPCGVASEVCPAVGRNSPGSRTNRLSEPVSQTGNDVIAVFVGQNLRALSFGEDPLHECPTCRAQDLDPSEFALT